MLTTMLLTAAALALPQHVDTTFAVTAGARLDVHNQSGDITINAWDRNAVRVRADLSDDEHIDVENQGAVVRVRSRRWRGGPADVDYIITVPASMALVLGGTSSDVSVEGVNGDISVQTVEGNITIRRAGGSLSLQTVDGDVQVDGGKGVHVNGVSGDVRITRAGGPIAVETIDGDVTLSGIDAATVDAGTVDGDVSYDGTISDGGTYHLSSHDGDVSVGVPAGTNATVSVSTFDGSFDSAFPVQLTQTQSGKRFTFTLGSGSARLELESFDGAIRLRRP